MRDSAPYKGTKVCKVRKVCKVPRGGGSMRGNPGAGGRGGAADGSAGQESWPAVPTQLQLRRHLLESGECEADARRDAPTAIGRGSAGSQLVAGRSYLE